MSAPRPPPSAARPEPSAKASENRRRVSMPIDSRHAAVVHRGAKLGAEVRALDAEPQQGDQHEADHDQEGAIHREGAEAEIELAAECGGQMDGLRQRAPQIAHDRHRHEDQADGEQHLVEFARAVQAGVERALEYDADQRHHDERREQREGERHGVAVHQRHGDVAAGHREHAVREVDEAHQAHGHRQADRDDVQDHRVGEAVEQDGGQGFHLEVAWTSVTREEAATKQPRADMQARRVLRPRSLLALLLA